MRKLGLPVPQPMPVAAAYNGSYHLEHMNGKFRFIVSDDRGSYVELKETSDKNELLGWIAIHEASWLTQQRVLRQKLPQRGKAGTLAWLKCNLEILAAVDARLAALRERELRALYRAQLGELWFR